MKQTEATQGILEDINFLYLQIKGVLGYLLEAVTGALAPYFDISYWLMNEYTALLFCILITLYAHGLWLSRAEIRWHLQCAKENDARKRVLRGKEAQRSR